MASEGYDSWEAVRNSLWRERQVVVEPRPNASVVDVSCSENTADSWAKHRAVVRLGYAGEIRIVVVYRDGAGRTGQIAIVTDKLSSWHRVVLRQGPDGGFERIDNGVHQGGGFDIGDAPEPSEIPGAGA